MTSPAAPRSASSPAEMHAIFKELLEAGDLEAIIGLYEQEAVMVSAPGELAAGPAQLREALAPLVAMQTKINFEPAMVAQAGELALVHAKWSATGTTPEGPMELAGFTSEVVRRQPDGTWKYLFDDPGIGVTAP